MRGRTPSADDTPKRAPPAPPREADVAGSKTSSEAVEVFSAAKTPASSVDARMVASTHSLDELGLSHPASASGDRQQQQEKHGHAYRSAQTAQDKRSRLSNVINNLRKKVPDSRTGESPRKEEDDRNSVERNLETLEKYVMTVLNGVIKDEEDDDRELGRKEAEKAKEGEKMAQEDSKGPGAKFEPSKPNESRTEALADQSEKMETKEPCSDVTDETSSLLEANDSLDLADGPREELDGAGEEKLANKCSSRERKGEEQETRESQEAEKRESRSLGAIIMERLSDHQSEDKEDLREFVPENVELRNVCRDLLNDLLNGINQLIDENSQEPEEPKQLTSSSEDCRDSKTQDFSMTSLHCSLPLDKVASVLQNCQTNDTLSPSSPSASSASSQGSKSPCKPPSPTVRHLCLYCDRKFLSISLRQRHTERVHQQGGGRRSERNSRKPSQNCQYCSDKCAESLEGLFHHMAGSHGDKYHACVQCSTRYLTREALVGHMNENHGVNGERSLQIQDKTKEPPPCKELVTQSPRDKPDVPGPKEAEHESRSESSLLKPMVPMKETFSNPGSPEFDSSFYSSVSCNIRENLLHHLDGKLQSTSSTMTSTSSTPDSKPQQSFYEHSVNQIQFPIDISLTAATPVYSKEYAIEEYENSSEYAQKPGKSNRSHPRRVSFEKYNFPRKYDGKEQWTCSIKDLSKFDISTQLSLRKKQQLLKERVTLNRLHQIPILGPSETTDLGQDEDVGSRSLEETGSVEEVPTGRNNPEATKSTECQEKLLQTTEFSVEFGNFLKLRKWDEKASNEAAKKQEVVYAELTGEWSRPRIYICGACATKHVTLREMEDHKASSHPNVWCSHFEFSGDQRELYKHLFLPGRDVPTPKARAAFLVEKVCTKCSKNYNALPELHRHMLECGGDQAWLLGLFGNGKKKCKWRPFGSRSRRRRQRGMKRNIQNSQTPRVNTPKEKQPTGPRVRPSDRESIQKMLANLPPKRATRKVLQESTMRTQGRLRNVQTRSRQRLVGDNSTASRMSRNKAVLRNKLLKNAKSIQRNRCRIDNISAVIESVVRNCSAEDAKSITEPDSGTRIEKDEAKERTEARERHEPEERQQRAKFARGPRVLGKKRNVRTKDGAMKSVEQKRMGHWKSKARQAMRAAVEAKESLEKTPEKSSKAKAPHKDPDPATSPLESKSPGLTAKNKLFAQTTPKKKRPVDPVASLNASIKAKSQLRTQDGKFARNPNKESPQKSPEVRPTLGRQLTKGPIAELGSEPSIVRSKLRPVSRNRNGDQVPKRTSRLSSDSDKMPTLEPAVQTSGDEYVETSANDLPILSPATLGNQEKTLRGKVSKSPEKREAAKRDEGLEASEAKDQFKGKGRRAKSVTKNLENAGTKGVKEKWKRKSAPSRIPDEEKKSPDESRREAKQKKLETKSRTKLETSDAPIKIQNVPFEVKKLIGPDAKEDLLTKLVLTSRVGASKRCLRQPVQRLKPGQGRAKQESGKSRFDPEAITEASSKRERGDSRRKSLRNTEKLEKDQTTSLNELGAEEVKTAFRGARNSDSDGTKGEIELATVDNEGTSTKRQTRGSTLLNANDGDTQTKETSNEFNDVSLKKTTSLGKRRGRIKSGNDVSEKRNADVAEPDSDLKDKEDESLTEQSKEGDKTVASLSLNHLQLDTSNSRDSGKENSLETRVVVQKMKVGRPRKSWGSRRERSKRSLNNVIGILTEGMNIPVETQQSLILTVQTSLENSNPEGTDQTSESSENAVPETASNPDQSNEETSCIENPEESQRVETPAEAKDSNAEESKDEKVDDAKGQPPPDIILDLSRRKQKGKGSFLEKIVSKIAKQKDALLEGEVGSLLDTAADELTSILDEVGPGFPESAEMNKLRSEKRQQVQGRDPRTNLEKEEPVDRTLEEKEDPETKENSSKAQEESIPTQSSTNVPESSPNLSADSRKEERGADDIKFKRKSKKRSVGGNSPKKTKRKSIEPENSEEELHLADVVKLIDESKHVPSTKENTESDEESERVQPGKRKTNGDRETKIPLDCKEPEGTEENKEVKKLRIETEENNLESSEQVASKIEEQDEEKSSTVRGTGKRKSLADTADQAPGIESPARRSSKRRSLPEERTNPEESDVREQESTLETRRRYSRTKLPVQLEEEMQKEGITEVAEEEKVEQPLEASGPNESVKIDGPVVGTEKVNVAEEAVEASKTEENLPVPDLKEPETVAETPVVPRVPKKRGRKKKCLAIENSQQSNEIPSENLASRPETQPTDLEPAITDKMPSKKAPRSGWEAEELSKNQLRPETSSDAAQIASPCLEHFKIPEVTEVLQHTKKRTSKRRSTTDEAALDTQNVPSTESEANGESSEAKEEAETCQRDSSSKKRGSNQEEVQPERSSSVGFISLGQTSRTRSSKRKQLSSEDLPDRSRMNQRTESVDNLSETSCVSESSYFRKKRFSKKKKGYDDPPEDVQTDTSVTDSESGSDRRQSLKRRAKKNLCFLEEIVDFFDIPADIQDCLQPEEGQGSEETPEVASTEAVNPESEEKDLENAEPEKSVVEEEEPAETAGVQVPEDFQAPKKRAAGNFVVVHKKTGEILIVEKRKKLTKEAARFFCDVCATSFTRKSSLKKHNLSQSHLLQVIKFKKDKTSETADEAWKNEASSDREETMNVQDSKDDSQTMNASEDSDSARSETRHSSVESDELLDCRTTRQQMEDELLDEEICKITENMSHDEYVLTEHTSPGPESTSTPIKPEVKETEEVVKKRRHEKKKEKGKKKNLADEHLALDTPEPEIPLEVSTAFTVLGTNTLLKIPKPLTLKPEAPTDSALLNDTTSKIDISDQTEDEFLDKCSESPKVLKLPESLDLDETRASESLEDTKQPLDTEDSQKTVYEVREGVESVSDQKPREHLSLKLIISKRNLELGVYETVEPVLDSKRPEETEREGPDLSLETETSRSSGNDFKTSTVENIEEDRQTPVIEANSVNVALEIETKSTRHGKSKKGKAKRILEDPENPSTDPSPSSDNRITRKRSKGNQNRQVVELPEPVQNEVTDLGLENDSEKTERGSTPESPKSESNRLEIVEDPQEFDPDLGIREILEPPPVEELRPTEDYREETIEPEGNMLRPEDDEASSSSSLADKPLAQLLLRTARNQETKEESLNFLNDSENLEPEDANDNEKPDPGESQVTSDEDCEPESFRPAEDSDGESKASSESENSETRSENLRDEKELEGKKTSKYSAKESRRRSKAKKTSVRSKLADLTSDSDDSESQTKSKIVKSVFGRVFGGEKTDKVKEVLNDWVSKSEDDSDVSGPTETKASEPRNEDRKRPGPKKRSGRRSKRTVPASEAQEDRPDKLKPKSKPYSLIKKYNTNHYCLVLPPNSCRSSKKRAIRLISEAVEENLWLWTQESSKQKKIKYGLRNQAKPDLAVKDSGYGSLNCDEDPSKPASVEPVDEGGKPERPKGKTKGRDEDEDWRDLMEKTTAMQSGKESGDEDDGSIKSEHALNRLSVDLESSCSSLAPSSVRNRSPSLDRNSQTTRDSDLDEEELGHRRISPLFVCGTPRSSVGSNSENEEDNMAPVARKRSSSEFSGEKVVIRSPSSTHKTEVVTIAPTDAIEDNALDVPQEIETAKPRQGKVLNFDEELFVECCSRLKATTENELRGAKKIKLDHNEGYQRKDEQQQGFRGPRDRWRDVESQNSLGSLLESVNQLLGEEMYSAREGEYPKRGGRNLRSEHSSRSASPDLSRADNLGYEDSLDVAFEHNNKLRDKIQQRMRESESLIASTFGQKNSNELEHPVKNDQEQFRDCYPHLPNQGQDDFNLSNGGYSQDVRGLQEQSGGKMNLEASGFKSKMNSALGGLLDKALSNLLHSNGKHDHNGSTPMKVLAELACARAPTSTSGDPPPQEDLQPSRTSPAPKDSPPDPAPLSSPKDPPKKARNPIKELFEKKKELNERKQQEKSKTEAALRELNVHRQRKTKKTKRHQDFPLIRRGEHGGLVERKKRRDGFERKDDFASDRIKDVYDFDEEESQMEPNLGVMSYRSRPGYEVSCLRTKEVDVAGLMSKAIGDSLENGKTDALSTRLESMIDRKFKELEKFAPKTKGALKAFQSEEQRHVTGPMDEFVERKQSRSRRPVEQTLKHSKLKKRSKNLKKKTRNAWYEDDSSDEYRTAVKTEDIGVGISKSQRTCSKGKQNLFAELYTSSESEFDVEDADYEAKRQRRVKKATKKVAELTNVDQTQELINKYCSENEDEWRDQDSKNDEAKNDCDNKKSESEMSDHPLVIDERKDADDQRNSDEETENQYERNYVLDDLYREDSSVVNSDVDDQTIPKTVPEECTAKSPSLHEEKIEEKPEYTQEDELIPLEEALDLLDQVNTNLETKYDREPAEAIEPTNSVIEAPAEETTEKCPTPVEEQDEDPDNDLLTLPEKLSSNEKPQKESDNLPLHVFLSRKVQESKKRKEQQLKKMQEEQERFLMDFQSTRRQRKCAIGKQGLLAEISSSDDEIYPRDRKTSEKSDHEKPRKQKRESKEKRKERYIEKKHEQMIAKEQKAIEEEIVRDFLKMKESITQILMSDGTDGKKQEDTEVQDKVVQEQVQKKKHQAKEKQKKSNKVEEDFIKNNNEGLSDLENNYNKPESNQVSEANQESPGKQKKHSKSVKLKKTPKVDAKMGAKKGKNPSTEKAKSRTDSKGSKDKERRSSSSRRDSGDEELKTTKSWNKVEEGVGVAIGRRKRAAANQLYYWSSSSDEEEMVEVVPAVEEEEDNRQEQHGWIVGDSHKRMITMLAMEKQLKEKRRRSEDEFEPGKAKSKKHRNSTS